jgi:chemotaxis family two-component system response regulator Rcp1
MRPVEVLLIEDNVGDILLIQQALAGESVPVSLHVAVDGEQAVELLTDHFHPDLIVLDLNIPKLTGLAVLEQCHPEVPVVVFTSSSSPRDHLRAIELGAKDYVQKASDLGEYMEQIRHIVRDWGTLAAVEA